MSLSPIAYRIVTTVELSAFDSSKSYAGNALDLKDGYLHMSTLEQTNATAIKYFSGRDDVHVLQVDLDHELIRSHVKWELVASRGALFPHLYDIPLPLSAVKARSKLTFHPTTGELNPFSF